MNSNDLTEKYYNDLGQFKDLCFSLIEGGQMHQVVLLCHELYRFLYPVEPYAGFEHSDPVPFMTAHLEKLSILARTLLDTVHGYANDPARTPSSAQNRVEIATSDLYSGLWAQFDRETLLVEARKLLERRLPADLIEAHIKGKRVLDMGCGSGRYSIALAALGAAEIIAVDYQAKAYAQAAAHASEMALPLTFQEADILQLPFPDRSFDFVFSNGVLHHTRDWKSALGEYGRVMKRSGYLYLYACGGFFWATRAVMREIFARIPQAYAQNVLDMIGMPSNRFIFMDTWYVPIEGHLKRAELEALMSRLGLSFTQVTSHVPFDPGYGLARGLPGAEAVWGEGEHRYLLEC
jgi:ubiquinone/menaquinone biosynthesis C-methylase UbiE